MKLIELDESYRGRELVFEYESACHYRAEPDRSDGDGFGVRFRKTPFPAPVAKRFTGTLLQDWLEEPRLFGMECEGRMIGFAETDFERWNNRVRITNFWVDPAERRRGVGKAMMAGVRKYAAEAGARALVLETQSCNYPALRFYRSCGFVFIGCDLTAYGDDDVAKGEVRLELGLRLNY